jgi:hypothetical protein
MAFARQPLIESAIYKLAMRIGKQLPVAGSLQAVTG